MKARINAYFCMLAVSDSVLLATAGALYPLAVFQYGDVIGFGPHTYVLKYLYPISNAAKTASIWLLIAMGCERWFAMSQPLRHQAVATAGHTRGILAIVTASACIYNLPMCFETTVGYCMQQQDTIPMIIPTALRNNKTYINIYIFALNCIFITAGPFVVQFALTLRISYVLKRSIQACRAMSWRGMATEPVMLISGTKKPPTTRSFTKKTSSIHLRESVKASTTKLFLAVAAKFLICNILPVITNSLEVAFDSAEMLKSPIFGKLVALSNLLVCINAAINLPLFIAFSERFRTTFLKQLFCVKQRFEDEVFADDERPRPLLTNQRTTTTSPTNQPRSTTANQPRSTPANQPRSTTANQRTDAITTASNGTRVVTVTPPHSLQSSGKEPSRKRESLHRVTLIEAAKNDYEETYL